MSMIGILVLAAGQSRRYGDEDKRLARLANGKRVIEQTLSNCTASGLPVHIVLRPDDDLLLDLCRQAGVAVTVAEDACQGMGHSLNAGIAAIKDSWDGCLIVLADMPMVQPQSYQAIAKALQQHDLVRPCYQGKLGQPNGFNRRYYTALGSCQGDSGAKQLLKTEVIHQLALDDAGILADIDTPAQLAALASS